MSVNSLFGSNFFGGAPAGSAFPSPFYDQASLHMPDQMQNALHFCESVFAGYNGTYRMAQERIVAYFLTDIDVSSADTDKPLGDDERQKWEGFLADVLNMKSTIAALDIDVACYGNGFATLVVPFKRFLVTPSGRLVLFREAVEHPSEFKLQYDAGRNKFHGRDPKTGQACDFKIHDEPDDLERKLRIKIWSPHDIEIIADPWTGDCDYVWKIPEDYKREIRRGNMYVLERAPTEILKAVAQDQWFLFAPGTMFHMKERTLSGIKMRGWGLSRTLANFRDLWYVQVLRRYNEAIALDYVIPFRLLTPEARNGNSAHTSDPLQTLNMGDFGAQVRRMLRVRRKDPSTWHTLPFPVKYQALGGDAQQLAPSELMDQAQDILLNAAGTPADFYRGNLQLQVAPVSLRLFEATHHNLVHNNNQFLRWAVAQASQLVVMQSVTAKMRRVTHADDFNKHMASLQMYMGQQLSGTTAFRSLGVDWKDEQRQIAEEARYQADLSANMQDEMNQTAFGEQIAKGQSAPGAGPAAGGAPAGGAPAGGDPSMANDPTGMGMSSTLSMIPDPSVPITPEELSQLAEDIAMTLLGLPASQRTSEMRELKNKHETLHALVKAKVEQQRNRARTAGASMLLGEQPAAGGAM